MAAANVQQPPAEAAPALPDYLTTPNATLGDKDANWRYGKAPDYSKTRKVWEDCKCVSFLLLQHLGLAVQRCPMD